MTDYPRIADTDPHDDTRLLLNPADDDPGPLDDAPRAADEDEDEDEFDDEDEDDEEVEDADEEQREAEE